MRGREGSNSPTTASAQQGKPLIHGPSSLLHHSFCFLSFPITPCCCAPPPSSHSSPQTSLCILSSQLHFLLTPCGSFLPPPLFITIPSPAPSAPHPSSFLLIFFLSNVLQPSPLPPSSLPKFSPPSLLCVTGLWGRRLPLHHQSDNHPHGKLQLPCLWL